MTLIPTHVNNGLPCRAVLTHYSPPVDNRWGHPDNWDEPDPGEIQFHLAARKGPTTPAPWIERLATQQDWARIERELIDHLEEERNAY